MAPADAGLATLCPCHSRRPLHDLCSLSRLQFLNFNTGYYKDNGDLVISRSHIAKHYLTHWFPIDFVSCLPVAYIGLLSQLLGGKEWVGEGNANYVRPVFILLSDTPSSIPCAVTCVCSRV